MKFSGATTKGLLPGVLYLSMAITHFLILFLFENDIGLIITFLLSNELSQAVQFTFSQFIGHWSSFVVCFPSSSPIRHRLFYWDLHRIFDTTFSCSTLYEPRAYFASCFLPYNICPKSDSETSYRCLLWWWNSTHAQLPAPFVRILKSRNTNSI